MISTRLNLETHAHTWNEIVLSNNYYKTLNDTIKMQFCIHKIKLFHVIDFENHLCLISLAMLFGKLILTSNNLSTYLNTSLIYYINFLIKCKIALSLYHHFFAPWLFESYGHHPRPSLTYNKLMGFLFIWRVDQTGKKWSQSLWEKN